MDFLELRRDSRVTTGNSGPPLWRRRTDAAVTGDRLSAGTLKGTLPPGLTCLQETEDHTAQEAGGHGGGGAGGGPSGLSVDERQRGSPGSPFEMSLSLPGPRANLSLRGPRPFPRRLKSEMKLSKEFTTGKPVQINGLEPYKLLKPFYKQFTTLSVLYSRDNSSFLSM